MNREMRRKLKQEEPAMKFTASQLEDYMQQAKWSAYKEIESGLKEKAEKSAKEVLVQLFGLTLMTMQKEYGWKEKRLNRLFHQLVIAHGEFEQGITTMDDLKAFMKNEVGIEERE